MLKRLRGNPIAILIRKIDKRTLYNRFIIIYFNMKNRINAL